MHHPETGEVTDPHNDPVFGKSSSLSNTATASRTGARDIILERARSPGGVPYFESTYHTEAAATRVQKPLEFETTYKDLGKFHDDDGEVQDKHNDPVFGRGTSFVNGIPNIQKGIATQPTLDATQSRNIMLERRRGPGGQPFFEAEAYKSASSTTVQKVPMNFETTDSDYGKCYNANGIPVDPNNSGSFGGTSRAWPGARTPSTSAPVWAE